MSTSGAVDSQTSLLGLPFEVRQLIYEHSCEWKESARDDSEWPIFLTGRGQGLGLRNPEPPNTLVTLPRVCKLINREFTPFLPAISQIVVVLIDFTIEDIRQWLNVFGDVRLSQLRHWSFSGCARGVGGSEKTMDQASASHTAIKGHRLSKRAKCYDRTLKQPGYCYRHVGFNFHVPEAPVLTDYGWRAGSSFPVPLEVRSAIDWYRLCDKVSKLAIRSDPEPPDNDYPEVCSNPCDWRCMAIAVPKMERFIKRIVPCNGNYPLLKKDDFLEAFQIVTEHRREVRSHERSIVIPDDDDELALDGDLEGDLKRELIRNRKC